MKISIEQLCKAYRNNIILNGLQLEINSNSVYCLLGKNGAGKSTLINILGNIIEPSSGTVVINDLNYRKNEVAIKKNMGIQSEFDQIIGEFNAFDYLQWIGLLYDMTKNEIAKQTNNLVDYFFEKEENLNGPSKDYSSGMRKKLMVCAALLNKPNLLILDEPFANLDPIASDKLCRFINAYMSRDRIVFVSSHDLLYVDKIATHIGIINDQHLVFDGTVEEFKKNKSTKIDDELLKYLNPKIENSYLLNAII
jgi:ABC-2 type transport system ATP-binding protein